MPYVLRATLVRKTLENFIKHFELYTPKYCRDDPFNVFQKHTGLFDMTKSIHSVKLTVIYLFYVYYVVNMLYRIL